MRAQARGRPSLVSIASSKLEASKTRSKADASHEYETRSAGDRDARIGGDIEPSSREF